MDIVLKEKGDRLGVGSRDEDIPSQVSFIVRERLHKLAQEVQRRTSTVRDELMRETPTESLSTVGDATRSEHRPSLISLIGLQVMFPCKADLSEKTGAGRGSSG